MSTKICATDELKVHLTLSNSLIESVCEKLLCWMELRQREHVMFIQLLHDARLAIIALKEEITEKDKTLQKISSVGTSSSTTFEVIRPGLPNSSVNFNQLVTTDRNLSATDDIHGLAPSLAHYKQQQQENNEVIGTLQKTVSSLESDLALERSQKQQLSNSLQYLRTNFDKLLVQYELSLDRETVSMSTIDDLKREVSEVTEQLALANARANDRDKLLATIQRLQSQVKVLLSQVDSYKFESNTECDLSKHLIKDDKMTSLRTTLPAGDCNRSASALSKD